MHFHSGEIFSIDHSSTIFTLSPSDFSNHVCVKLTYRNEEYTSACKTEEYYNAENKGERKSMKT